MSFSSKIPDYPIPTAHQFLEAAATGDEVTVRRGLESIDPTVQDLTGEVAKKVAKGDSYHLGLNALHLACKYSQRGIIEILLNDKNGKKTLSQKDNGDKTALHHLASRTDALDIIEKLLKAGAATDIISHSQTPLSAAASRRNKAAMELLLNHERKGTRDILNLFLFSDVSGIVLEYHENPTINLTTDSGRTPLYWAISANIIGTIGAEQVSLLLKHRANPLQECIDSVREPRITMIEYARRRTSPEITKLLEDRAKEIKATE